MSSLKVAEKDEVLCSDIDTAYLIESAFANYTIVNTDFIC